MPAAAGIPVAGLAVRDAASPLAPWAFQRRTVGPRDVQIAIHHCGVCHSDLHTARGEWGAMRYPLVPGHEIVGRVVAVGRDVTRHAIGDAVGVGCIVDSCRDCDACRRGLENYCERGSTGTYAGIEQQTGLPTQGGYSTGIVVDEAFVVKVPASLDLAAAAPLLCAGVTTWSPLRHWEAGPGTRVGVVGLGGLGHMAIRLAAALGAEVTAFTTSPAKADDARRLGAQSVVVADDAPAWRSRRNSLDLILDTVSGPHDVDRLLRTLRLDGAMVMLGLSPDPMPFPGTFTLASRRRTLAGSMIGGIPETQAMLDFCGTHGLGAEIERITAHDVNIAWQRMVRGDVRYRFVIDCETIGMG
ncbi:MAG: NAD(P)-dependent alcohol dehydrogenase [Gemmatimonadetes bacterium]|nr:NAD(P)-dependent alcohol dehydrogenase [Gemmatimonadota bacterium]